MRHPLSISCLAATAALLVACVPALPGSSLGESGESTDGSAGSAASSGAAATGGSTGGSGVTSPTSAGGATSPTGAGGSAGIGGPGSGGSAAGGTSAGPLPCPGIATFDTPDLQGFALLIDHASGNPASVNRSGWAKLTVDGTQGDPSPGSLRIDVPLNDYNQFIDVRRTIGTTFGGPPPQNWISYRLHVRVKIASGVGIDPGDVATVEPYVLAAGSSTACAVWLDVPSGNGWHDYALDLGECPSIDPSMVTAYGISVLTGVNGGQPNPVNPMNAVIYVDSFSLEGSCDGGGGTGSLACSNMPTAVQSITNFDDATAGDPITFSTAPGMIGQVVAATPGLPAAAVSIVPGENGTNALRVESASGIGTFVARLMFAAPIDARAYNALRLAMHFLAPCTAGIGLVTACAQTFCPVMQTTINRSGTICAPIAGVASSADLASVTGIVFTGADKCAFTIDDLSFVQQ